MTILWCCHHDQSHCESSSGSSDECSVLSRPIDLHAIFISIGNFLVAVVVAVQNFVHFFTMGLWSRLLYC